MSQSTPGGFVLRSGMKPWCDVFHALRRGCATEWKQTHPAYAVETWLGHCARVSEKHYLMIPDALWDRVGGVGQGDDLESAARGAVQGAAAGPRIELRPVEVSKDDNTEELKNEVESAILMNGQGRS